MNDTPFLAHQSREIDKVLNNQLKSSEQVKARDYTPKYLVENGARNLPMLITQKHIKTIIYTEAEAKKLGLPIAKGINYHGLGKELLVQAIDNMDSPAEVYKKDADNFIIITNLTDNNGDTIIVPVRINGKGIYNDVYIDENHITSAYGKRNLQNYLANNNFEKIEIKEGIALNEGVQYSNISNSSKDSISQNSENTTENLKKNQLEIINQHNPAPNTYNTWVRSVNDIKTFEEALADDEYAVYDEFVPDYTRTMAEKAIEDGEITVYSSYPIEQGIFVSPSYMEAASYSGDGNVYSKRVPLDAVAWIDVTQGQYADTKTAAGEQKNSLSDSTEDIGPLPGWNVKGSDIAYDDLPIRKDVAQQPSSSNVTEIEVGDKKYILNDSDSVSYSTLVKRGNIANTTIEEKYSESNDYDLQERIKTAIDSCEKVVENQGYVKLNSYPYTIRITKEGLRHGLVGKRLSGKRKRITGKEFEHKNIHYNNANICESFGEIIKNSIIVNELGDRSGGLVLMGYVTSPGGQYVVRTIVKKVGDSYSIESWDSNLNLKAVNTKKIETQRVVDDYPTEQENNSTSNVPNISIEEFLQIVNDVSPEFADTLSGDVLMHLNGKRSEKPSIAVRFADDLPIREDYAQQSPEDTTPAAELEEDVDMDDMAAEDIVNEKIANLQNELDDVRDIREKASIRAQEEIDELQLNDTPFLAVV